MNRYLEKIAEIAKKDKNNNHVASRLVEAGAGAAIASKAPAAILGYHNLYHGTSNSTAEKIMKEGFKPSTGGSGASKHSSKAGFQDQSKGKVHFTKKKFLAKFFSGYTEHGENNPKADHLVNTGKGLLNIINPFSKGKVLKVRVSDKAYKEFEVDPHMAGNKDIASTINKRVSPASIVGHKNNKGVKQFLSRRHLFEYYSDKAGKIRGLKGAATGLAGGGPNRACNTTGTYI